MHVQMKNLTGAQLAPLGISFNWRFIHANIVKFGIKRKVATRTLQTRLLQLISLPPMICKWPNYVATPIYSYIITKSTQTYQVWYQTKWNYMYTINMLMTCSVCIISNLEVTKLFSHPTLMPINYGRKQNEDHDIWHKWCWRVLAVLFWYREWIVPVPLRTVADSIFHKHRHLWYISKSYKWCNISHNITRVIISGAHQSSVKCWAIAPYLFWLF
jgi:hypothetical protein